MSTVVEERYGTVQERVARGLAFILDNAEALDLDINRIDRENIDIVSGTTCVLAQAASDDQDYFDVKNAAGVDVWNDEDWGPQHGFNVARFDSWSKKFMEIIALETEWDRVLADVQHRP